MFPCLISMDILLAFSVLQINSLKHRLNDLREVLKEISQDNIDLVPEADKIDVTKLCNGANITTDTCNAAQKLRRILVEKLVSVLSVIACIIFATYGLETWRRSLQRSSTVSYDQALLRSIQCFVSWHPLALWSEKLIRNSAYRLTIQNYTESYSWLEGMRVKHLNELILRVERASGSRQDLCTEGIMTILMNCLYYVDILDRSQRKRKKNDKASILQLNLFLGLISSDMIVLVRLLSIL